MPLSNRIIKTKRSSLKEGDEWLIESVIEENDEDDLLWSQEATQHIEEARQKKKKIVGSAEEQANQILQEAKEEAKRLKAEAEKEGYQSGKEQGYQEGFQSGKQEGYRQAQQETEEMKQKAREMISQAQLQIEEYIEVKKESLLSLSIHMAEKIVHEQLYLSPDGILELVQPILHQLDREEDFVSLTIHPTIREVMKERLPELETIYPGVRFALLTDETLEVDGCIIESAHKVVDLQVRKQLEAMMAELKERERDV